MANADKPAGFKVGYTKHGGPAALNRYYASGTGGAIYRGDAVVQSTKVGHIKTFATTTSSAFVPIGVASHYSAAGSSAAEVLVYDDLFNTVFVGQDSATALVGVETTLTLIDLVLSASTTTQQSTHELNSALSVVDGVKVIDLVERPDNAWGEFCDVYFEFYTDPFLKIRTSAATA